MDDNQLDSVLAALEGTPAPDSKQSEAKPEGEKPEAAKTETTRTEEVEKAAGDDAGADDKSEGGDENDGTEDKPKPKKLSGSERWKRRAAAAEAELQALRAARPTQDVASEVEKIIGKPPKEDDYKGDYLAFERAQTVYELDKRQAEREVRSRTSQQEARAAELRREAAEAHQERVEEFRQKATDFDDVLRSAADLKASPTVEDLILDSDKSAHLVYFLAKHPDRLHALNGMSERQAAREIGRIESRLSLPQPKTQTQAPKPVTPPKGGAAVPSVDREIDSYLAKTYGKGA